MNLDSIPGATAPVSNLAPAAPVPAPQELPAPAPQSPGAVVKPRKVKLGKKAQQPKATPSIPVTNL